MLCHLSLVACYASPHRRSWCQCHWCGEMGDTSLTSAHVTHKLADLVINKPSYPATHIAHTPYFTASRHTIARPPLSRDDNRPPTPWKKPPAGRCSLVTYCFSLVPYYPAPIPLLSTPTGLTVAPRAHARHARRRGTHRNCVRHAPMPRTRLFYYPFRVPLPSPFCRDYQLARVERRERRVRREERRGECSAS